VSEPAIIIVAYRGELAGLQHSLAAIADETTGPVSVLASDDPALIGCAEQRGVACNPVLPPTADTEHYWSLVSRALAGHRGDCLVIRAGTGFLSGLGRRLRIPGGENAAALFPLSVRHAATSVFSSPDHAVGLDVASIDRWLNIYTTGLVFDLPGFCGYTALLRPQLIDAGDHANDMELAAATLLSGASLLCTDNVYVDDSHLDPADMPDNCYPAWCEAVHTRHPLTGVRHALTELSSRAEPPPPDLPRVCGGCLHISHPWGGGISQWINDFAEVDADTRHYTLKSIGDWDAHGKSLALYEHPDEGEPLGWWTLARPILSTARHHHEYQTILREVIAQFSIDCIVVSSLVGHSLDSLRTEVPTLVVCHDFYPACPILYASFDGPCDSCESPRLHRCLESNPEHRFFRAEPASNWLQMREQYAQVLRERDIPVIAPGNTIARRLTLIAPELASQQIAIVPHGLPPALSASLHTVQPANTTGERLRVVVLGSLQAHKGLHLIRELCAQPNLQVDFHLLGCGEAGEELAAVDAVQVTERYERSELAEHLSRISPDLGLLLSTVPESYSYTLSELQAAHIPVLATNIGAFAERIRNGHTGWLVPPDVKAVARILKELSGDRTALHDVRQNLRGMDIPSTQETVSRYYAALGDTRRRPLMRPPYLRKRSPLG